jgi:drug/metabolite transporter (DMT)-like permease
MPTMTDFLLMAGCGPIAAIGTTLLSNAYRTAQASLVAPFEYTWLLWAGLWGYLIWGDIPGPWTYVGAALIAGSGMFLMVIVSGSQAKKERK